MQNITDSALQQNKSLYEVLHQVLETRDTGLVSPVSLTSRAVKSIADFVVATDRLIELSRKCNIVDLFDLVLEISNIADITVVVFNPYTRDSIQTIKAGITEIGDIYLVHKSDLDGASQLFQSVQDFIGTLEKNLLNLKVSSKTEKEFLNL